MTRQKNRHLIYDHRLNIPTNILVYSENIFPGSRHELYHSGGTSTKVSKIRRSSEWGTRSIYLLLTTEV